MVPATRADAAYAVGGTALAVLVGTIAAAVGPIVLALPVVGLVLWLVAKAAVNVTIAPRKIVLGITAALPALAAATQVLPGAPGRAVPIAALAVGIALMPRTIPLGTRTAQATAAYVALMSVALVRGWSTGAIASASTAVALVLLVVLTAWFGLRLFTSGDDSDRYQRALALALAPAVFVAANVFFYLVGDRLPVFVMPEVQEGLAAGNPATMLVSLGFGGAERIGYPLAQGVNSFGVVAALGIVTCTLTAWQLKRTERRLALVFLAGTALCLGGTLTADSRTALFVALAATLGGILRLRSKAAGRLAVLLPFTPLALIAALSALASTQVATALSRDGGDFATGTGRTAIWSAIWDGTLADVPATSLIGWGANGQLTSGAFRDYAYIFGNQRTQLYTAHDIYLQTILDIGWIGLAVLVAVFVVAIARLLSSPRVVIPAFGWALLALMLCGITEAIPSYQFPETITLFILLLTADAGRRARPPKPQRGPTMSATGNIRW